MTVVGTAAGAVSRGGTARTPGGIPAGSRGGSPAVVPAAVAGALATAGAARVLAPLAARRPLAWSRPNHRAQPVSLVAGPAAAAGVALPLAVLAVASRERAGEARVLAAAAGLAIAAAAVGRYDDTAGARPSQRHAKGLRGHLAALRAGQLTSGTVKVVGIGAAATAATMVARVPRASALPAALLVAGGANLANLFDLRPGRALKVVAVPALGLATAPTTRDTPAGLLGAVTLGAAAALLPGDLRERTMLGDAGANALGAVLGLAAAVAPAPRLRAAALPAVVLLTAASEVVSFSRVIDATPPLARLDRLGRLPA